MKLVDKKIASSLKRKLLDFHLKIKSFTDALKEKKQDLLKKCDKSERNFEEIEWLLSEKKEKFNEKFTNEELSRGETIWKNQFYIGKLIEIVKNINIFSKNQEIPCKTRPFFEEITVKNIRKNPISSIIETDVMKLVGNSSTFLRFVKPFTSLKFFSFISSCILSIFSHLIERF